MLNQNYFQEINLDALKVLVRKWANRFPAIGTISLYHGIPKNKPYVLVLDLDPETKFHTEDYKHILNLWPLGFMPSMLDGVDLLACRIPPLKPPFTGDILGKSEAAEFLDKFMIHKRGIRENDRTPFFIMSDAEFLKMVLHEMQWQLYPETVDRAPVIEAWPPTPPAVGPVEAVVEKPPIIKRIPKCVTVKQSGNVLILNYRGEAPAHYYPAKQNKGWKYLLLLLQNPGRNIPFTAFEKMEELSAEETQSFSGISIGAAKRVGRPRKSSIESGSSDRDPTEDESYDDVESYNVKTYLHGSSKFIPPKPEDDGAKRPRKIADHLRILDGVRGKIQLFYDSKIKEEFLVEGESSEDEDIIKDKCLTWWNEAVDAFKEATHFTVLNNWDSHVGLKIRNINPIRAENKNADKMFRRVKENLERAKESLLKSLNINSHKQLIRHLDKAIFIDSSSAVYEPERDN